MFARVRDIDRMFDAMGLLRGQFGSMLSDYEARGGYGPSWSSVSNYPRTNLYDDGEQFHLIAEVPGLTPEALDVKIQGNYVEITGELKVDPPKGYRAHRSERSSASFTRSLTLPSDVDADKVSASLKDGILLLKLPKSEAAKPRQISIS
jgi:HSP20 family protein